MSGARKKKFGWLIAERLRIFFFSLLLFLKLYVFQLFLQHQGKICRENISFFFFSILTFFIRWYILEKGRRKGGRNFVSLTTILHIPKSFLLLLLSLLFYLSQRKNSPLSAVWWRWRRIAFYIADVTNHHVATLHRLLFVFLFSCFFKLL